MTLTVHTLESIAALEAISPAWAALDRETRPRLPFSGPDWNLLWWKHFAEARSMVRDRLYAQVVFDGRKLVAVAPMMITERPGLGPMRGRLLQFLGADPYVTEIRGPCCRRADEGPFMEAILAHLERRAGEWDWVRFGGIVENGPAHQALGMRPRVEWVRPVPDFLLELGDSWEDFKSTLPRNLKEALRKCYASLRRDDLQHEFVVAATQTEVEAALEVFLRLHAARASSRLNPPHPNVFGSTRASAFLADYLRTSAASGAARVFVLYVDGRPVAARVGFLFGEQLYLYFSGYEPAMSTYSVMTTCVAETLRWAIGMGVRTVNLSPGRDRSKTRWRPAELSLIEVQLISPSLRVPAAHRAFASFGEQLRHAARTSGALGGLLRLASRRR